ncbi:MAG: ATP-binding protein [Mariprofundaceae bacterium]|nr:ATP-binding protein [Mariprofundaceae bacterium]
MKIEHLVSQHLSIKIGLWLMIIFIMVAMFGWDILQDMKRLRFEASIVEGSNHKSHELHNLEISINRYIDPMKEFLITGDYRLEAYFNQRHQSLLSSIQTYEHHYADDSFRRISDQLQRIYALSHRIFALPFAVGNMEGPILLKEVNEHGKIAVLQLSEQHQNLDIQVNDAMRMMDGLRMDMRDDALVLLLILLMTLIFLTHFIYSQIVLPLVRMRKAAQQIGEGDFTQQSPVTSQDEIGELASALNTMGQALQERDKHLDHARNLSAYQEKMNALGFIAAGIAHEIGNPLAAISVSLQVAQKKLGKKDHHIDHHIEAALVESERIESIIQMILNFSRHDPHRHLHFFKLQPVIDNAVYLAQMSPDKKTIHVSTDIDAHLPVVYSDESIVLQVLINLILNAIDACKGGGSIIIHAFEGMNGVMLNVKDTGSGIPTAVQQAIFEPHFTSKPRGQGTGLGLAISRELLHSIQSSLQLIHSDEHGSCFQIYLPMSEKELHETVNC